MGKRKADEVAERIIIGFTDAMRGENPDFDLSDVLQDGDDVTAFFEALLTVTAYFYKSMVDDKADLFDVTAILNRLAVARIVQESGDSVS